MNSLGLNGLKIHAIYLVDLRKEMTWWHDDMMQCTWCNDECKEPNKSHDETRKPWKATEALVLGRYNTPPLREDLVPRSRMAPKGKRKRKRRGKTKLLLWQTSETKEPREVEQIREKNTTKVNKVESSPVGKSFKEEQIRTALRLKRDARLDKAKRTWAKRSKHSA